MSEEALERCIAKMRQADVSAPAIDNFRHYWRLCAEGATGLIREDTIRPLLDVTRLEDVEVSDADARAALQKTVIIKLNGGLGTSMGLDRAKTLLTVRDGRSFLDLIVAQVQHARKAYNARLPVMFMNSFRTRQDTLEQLGDVAELQVDGLPLDFLQNAEPKIRRDDLSPVEWPADPTLEWCPPGHGDLYPALLGSGVLDALIEAGFRYASVANGDNLGAAPDARLAGWFAASGAPYAAELCPRTVNDRKGGHLAVRISDGQLILRDTAQTAPEEMDYFTDEHRHPFFHTNNLWMDLVQVREVLRARDGVLGLPLIRNEKTVDPADPASTPVIQLESAMGAAIEVFAGGDRRRRAQGSFPSGQDHQRTDAAALGRLRPRRGRTADRGRADSGDRPRPAALQAGQRLRPAGAGGALPSWRGRIARPGGVALRPAQCGHGHGELGRSR